MINSQILIVDDDRLILHTLSAGLRSAGYQTVVADSGEAAIRSASELPLDLAIVDVTMPGMSGLELAVVLQRDHGIPCLFLSAHADAAMVERAVAEGALGYLVKPLDVPNIIPSVEAALVRAREISGLRQTQAQLNVALNQNREVSIAIGMLMGGHGLSQERAFEALRAAARKERRKVSELASEVISGQCSLGKIIEMGGERRSVRNS